MSGPVAGFGLGTMRLGGASPKQKESTQTTNPEQWKPSADISVSQSPKSLLALQLPVYTILFLSGFSTITGFALDATVLATLAGVAVASMFPYSISVGVGVIKSIRGSVG